MRFLILIIFLLTPLNALFAEDIPKYKRSYFGGWSDEDGDCQNTRHELLKELSTSIMTFTDSTCRVLTGRWLDLYTNKIFQQSSKVDIDHLVPLHYAWQRGAHRWDKATLRRFSNDTRNLFVVQKSVNREKSASGPLEWLPPNKDFRCIYVVRFERIMKMYHLQLTGSEERGFGALKAKYC